MDFISTREELRSHYKAASDMSLRKELKALDGHSRNFIAKSPFVLIGSSDSDGNADVTPKGDKPGFVAVPDDVTLAVPDRPGVHARIGRLYRARRCAQFSTPCRSQSFQAPNWKCPCLAARSENSQRF